MPSRIPQAPHPSPREQSVCSLAVPRGRTGASICGPEGAGMRWAGKFEAWLNDHYAPSRMRPSLSQHRAVLAAVNTEPASPVRWRAVLTAAARGRAFLRAGRDEETAPRPNKETPMGLNARYGGMANEGSGGASRCLSPCARAGRRQTTASRYPCHPHAVSKSLSPKHCIVPNENICQYSFLI